jgi:uncharacterized protein (TIGR02996 family)
MSTDEAALLNSVIGAPDDDLPRLIYADWLEENGRSERAEFIRLQIAAAAGKADLDQVQCLLLREAELLAAHADSFAGALAGEGLYWHYRRGFIHRFGHDGVYRCPNTGYSSYLRFYPDGTVLTVSSTGDPAQVMTWFAPDHPHISQGRYSLQWSPTCVRVEFSSTDVAGTVDFNGMIEGQTILLNSHSQINGHRSQDRYVRVDV